MRRVGCTTARFSQSGFRTDEEIVGTRARITIFVDTTTADQWRVRLRVPTTQKSQSKCSRRVTRPDGSLEGECSDAAHNLILQVLRGSSGYPSGATSR